jgi:imidazoleglycerol phosphate synthase glutamine amidotransferase subunit HisH
MEGGQAPRVAIVDYSLGNLFSVKHACEKVGLQPFISSDKQEILAADAVILPGVGAFGDAMECLRQRDLIRPLQDIAESGKTIDRHLPRSAIAYDRKFRVRTSSRFEYF